MKRTNTCMCTQQELRGPYGERVRPSGWRGAESRLLCNMLGGNKCICTHAGEMEGGSARSRTTVWQDSRRDEVIELEMKGFPSFQLVEVCLEPHMKRV